MAWPWAITAIWTTVYTFGDFADVSGARSGY
jgi:hypothetical protein